MRLATASTVLVVLAAVPAAAVVSSIVRHGDRAAPRVALTFDLCPTQAPAELDQRIVDTLVATGTKATFFVSGRWAEALPDAVRRLAAEPLFEIGNHTFRHRHLRREPEGRIRDEIVRTQELLATLTGRPPRLWRPPYGEVDDRIAGVAATLGLVTIEFDVASGDPSATATRSSLVRGVLGAAKPGAIVVMHANHRRFATAAALPEIVTGLRARGLELVTVSELLERSPVEGAAGIR